MEYAYLYVYNTLTHRIEEVVVSLFDFFFSSEACLSIVTKSVHPDRAVDGPILARM